MRPRFAVAEGSLVLTICGNGVEVSCTLITTNERTYVGLDLIETERTAEAYWKAAQAAFSSAVAAAGEISRDFRVGSAVIRLRFAGTALVEPMTRALAAIAIDPVARPDLTIDCWDSASTGTPMTAPYWPMSAYGPKGHIIGFNTAAIHTLYSPGIGTLHLYNRSIRSGLYWVAAADRMPQSQRSAPLREFIHWWSRDLPLQLMHAGAVGFADGGVLLAGRSGSGKSTTALAGLASGLLFASDDYICVALSDQPWVYSLYSTAKLVPDNLSCFPELSDKLSNPDQLATQKAMVDVQAHFPDRLLSGFPIRSILLPRVTGDRETQLRSAAAADAVLALAPTTLAQLEGHSRETFAKIVALSGRVPTYWLDVGTDLPMIAGVIANHLGHG
jgi:hypothetical protein